MCKLLYKKRCNLVKDKVFTLWLLIIIWKRNETGTYTTTISSTEYVNLDFNITVGHKKVNSYRLIRKVLKDFEFKLEI